MAEQMKLFKIWSSAYGLRIVWASKLMGIQFDPVDEDLSNKSSLLLKYNPVHKKIPVLVHNGKPISESLVILEYIDETWKRNPLQPEDPSERARACFLAKVCDDKVMPSMWNAFKVEGQGQEEAIGSAMENLKVLEEELGGKKFFGGEKIGFTDLAFGWLANLMSVFEENTGIKMIDEERFPSLSVWIQAFSGPPVIKESWPSRDKLVVKFRALRPREIRCCNIQMNQLVRLMCMMR